MEQRQNIPVVQADPDQGLTNAQAEARIASGGTPRQSVLSARESE